MKSRYEAAWAFPKKIVSSLPGTRIIIFWNRKSRIPTEISIKVVDVNAALTAPRFDVFDINVVFVSFVRAGISSIRKLQFVQTCR
jgi:hypothetical protein